ncbi:hypothetical protein IWW36_002567 [Coemansia brasiliensis]|uniref:Uncharacterized protein n=1 Tax=Coemansia brasiliensis TaxID=2650707 RepID=A0A9W8LZC1_9FUNG|nr:hypothetical protein IWW36_002567 [Coemansia brasiliensis]
MSKEQAATAAQFLVVNSEKNVELIRKDEVDSFDALKEWVLTRLNPEENNFDEVKNDSETDYILLEVKA